MRRRRSSCDLRSPNDPQRSGWSSD